MPQRYTASSIPFARQLRREMPPAERKLWFDGLRHLPQHFRRQRLFGPYIVDFYCAAASLVVELDGESHNHAEAQAADARRDAYLGALGLRVLRFTNAEVLQQLEGVVAAIAEAAATPPSALPTPPLRSRGGKTADPPLRCRRGKAASPPLLAGEVSPQVTEG